MVLTQKSISLADSKMNQLQTELEGANARATEVQTQVGVAIFYYSQTCL